MEYGVSVYRVEVVDASETGTEWKYFPGKSQKDAELLAIRGGHKLPGVDDVNICLSCGSQQCVSFRGADCPNNV